MKKDQRLMYRPTPKNPIKNDDREIENWPFLIEVQGSPNRMNWGQLVAQIWGHCGTWPDKIEGPEYYARLFSAAPRMLAALQAVIDNPNKESLDNAKEAIDEALERSSCPVCKGDTRNMPCKNKNCKGGMVKNRVQPAASNK